ncbi:MAG: hypothetical protein AAF394_18910, partial [Planctomycetota bacterium]
IDWLLLGLLVLGWVFIAGSKNFVGPVLVLFGAVGLVALNQHRFQPWHYQLSLVAALFLVREEKLQRKLLQWLVISIYIYSALSKIDFEFLFTVGASVVEAGLGRVGDTTQLSTGAKLALACMMPLVELTVAVGLIWQRTRWISGWLACTLHLGLVLLFSPLVLNHSLGVMLWNVHFVGLAWLLFVRKAAPLAESVRDVPTMSEAPPLSVTPQVAEEKTQEAWLPKVLLAPVLFLPLLERVSWWDHWPSWALYAPHSSRVVVEVAASAKERLPQELQDLMQEEDQLTQIWIRVPIDKWSLEQLGVPIYPQARFQAGIALHLSKRVDSPFEVRATVLGPAARLDGKRSRREYKGTKEIERIGEPFLWSIISRSVAQEEQVQDE